MLEELNNLKSEVAELKSAIEGLTESPDRLSGGSNSVYRGIYRPVTPSDRDAILSVIPTTTTAQTFTVPMTLAWTLPQTANNYYGVKWIAPFACTVISIQEMHKDSSSPNALTLDVRKGASTSLLATPFDMAAVGGDYLQVGTLTSTAADLVFAAGDSLQWAASASVGNITGVCVTVEFQVN